MLSLTRKNRPQDWFFPPAIAEWMDELFRGTDVWEARGEVDVRGVAADVYETDDAVVVEMAVPGIEPDNVEIQISGDTLTVSGETKQEEAKKERNYHLRQIRYGKFSQSLVLPVRVKGEDAEANFKNGMLRITIPKAEEAKTKSIKVKIKDE